MRAKMKARRVGIMVPGPILRRNWGGSGIDSRVMNSWRSSARSVASSTDLTVRLDHIDAWSLLICSWMWALRNLSLRCLLFIFFGVGPSLAGFLTGWEHSD